MSVYVVTLGDGRQIGAGAYARAIKQAKANPEIEFTNGINWWPETGADIYNRFRRVTVHDMINQRGKMQIRECTPIRLLRKCAKHLTVTCAWCGQPIAKPGLRDYDPQSRACCSPECYRTYWG